MTSFLNYVTATLRVLFAWCGSNNVMLVYYFIQNTQELVIIEMFYKYKKRLYKPMFGMFFPRFKQVFGTIYLYINKNICIS